MQIRILKPRHGRHEIQVMYPRRERKPPVILRGTSAASVKEGLAPLLTAQELERGRASED